MVEKQKVVVVGAGLAGSLMAIYLARRGFEVAVYEQRHDIRRQDYAEGRSINLGLSARGIQALTEAGLIDKVMADAVRMKGRMIHAVDGFLTFQPYGTTSEEVLHSIDRNELNKLLISEADTFDNVTFHFKKQCVRVDKEQRLLQMYDADSQETETITADLVIGADGAFSRIRQQLQRGERASYEQEFLDWGYKELSLPPGPNNTSLIEHEALHVWPRGNALIVSHANKNGSHTLTLFLPFENETYCFETLQTPDDVLTFFKEQFSDVIPLLPDLTEQFFTHPTGKLVTIQTAPWYYQDWVVLVGDAAHAVYPFYGQGMNSALEDCTTLDRCIERYGASRNWENIFRTFQAQRKPHTDTLAELSKQNFIELSSKLKSPWFVLRKQADIVLNRLFPQQWLPIYTMIAHTTIPYADAVERAAKQERVLKWGLTGLGAVVVLLLLRLFRPKKSN